MWLARSFSPDVKGSDVPDSMIKGLGKNGVFLSNLSRGADANIYEADLPYGPFLCRRCGATGAGNGMERAPAQPSSAGGAPLRHHYKRAEREVEEGNMVQNKLTQAIYAAGYTKERHPDYVRWDSWHGFVYRREYLAQFTWETSCGLLISGKSAMGVGLTEGDVSFQGIYYCPENDNPMLLCPYKRKDCPHIPKGFPMPHCPCRRTDRLYYYENSAEKAEKELTQEKKRKYIELTQGAYCACVVGDNACGGTAFKIQYDVEKCIRSDCRNPFCVARQQERDLRRANVYYDVRRVWITRTGFLRERKEMVTKGKKVFPKPVARTDAEIWLSERKDSFAPLQSKSTTYKPGAARKMLAQEELQRSVSQYVDQDCVYYQYHVENIRVAAREHRDMERDQLETERGVEVVYATDAHRTAVEKKRAEKRTEWRKWRTYFLTNTFQANRM